MMPWRWRFWRLAGGASDGTLVVDKDGVHRPRPPTDCFNYPEPEKR